MTAIHINIYTTVLILLCALSNPIKDHMITLNRVRKYLAGTLNLAIHYSSNPNSPGLCSYCDADWAGPHSEIACSTSGYIFTLVGGPISWSSKKQSTVALSSTESEYIAMALAT